MTLGDRALTELALMQPTQWQDLAAQWLAWGYDSLLLREFATVPNGDSHALAVEFLPDVLRSLGIDLPPFDNVATLVCEVSGFATRCREALNVIQRDLDRTRYEELRVVPSGLLDFPLDVYASVVGRGHAVTGPSEMQPYLTDVQLLLGATDSVIDTLTEVVKIRWPRCIEHPGRLLAARYLTVSDGRGECWWWCGRDDGHRVAELGELRYAQVADSKMAGT
jgi:hypothetical protein